MARALRRSQRLPRSIAFLGDADGRFAARVARWLPHQREGAIAILVEATPADARMALGVLARRGWTGRALGLSADDWLADPAGARADAIVAWRVLHRRDEAARGALLQQLPRRAATFVACEPAGSFGEGGITALWPRWHSCVIRERAGRWWGHRFEARSL